LSSSDIWLTPRFVIAALGGSESFDLDPCASENRPWDTARTHLTWREDGLKTPWPRDARPFLNPPYISGIGPWVDKLLRHGRGVALLFAKTDTQAFMRIFDHGSAMFFIEGRLRFHMPDGAPAKDRAPHPSVLCAWGEDDAEVLSECGLEGRFVPLQLPRRFAVLSLEQTWREAVHAWIVKQDGPVTLAALYRAFTGHAKTRQTRNYEAKIRQTLQRGPFERIGPGLWAVAAPSAPT